MFKHSNGRQYFRSGMSIQVVDMATSQWITDDVDQREVRAAFDALVHWDKALAYAWGHEDASGTKTFEHKDRIGPNEFAETFAASYFDYNMGARGYMTNLRDAYDTWQRTEGRTIFREDAPTVDTELTTVKI